MSHSRSNKAFILIAPQFDEVSVVQCIAQMRTRGISVSLVGLMSGLLNGSHGLVVHPDLTVSELEQMSLCERDGRLLVIPGGRESAALLFSDPRVHQICEAALKANGYVAALTTAQQVFVRSGCIDNQNPSRFLPQNDVETNVFLQELMAKVNK